MMAKFVLVAVLSNNQDIKNNPSSKRGYFLLGIHHEQVCKKQCSSYKAHRNYKEHVGFLFLSLLAGASVALATRLLSFDGFLGLGRSFSFRLCHFGSFLINNV